MTDHIAAMRQAREALQYAQSVRQETWDETLDDAIAVIDAALAKVQEPAAWQDVHCQTDLYLKKPAQVDVRPLYAAPPAPAATVLTDAEIEAAYEKAMGQHLRPQDRNAVLKVVRATIEAAILKGQK